MASFPDWTGVLSALVSDSPTRTLLLVLKLRLSMGGLYDADAPMAAELWLCVKATACWTYLNWQSRFGGAAAEEAVGVEGWWYEREAMEGGEAVPRWVCEEEWVRGEGLAGGGGPPPPKAASWPEGVESVGLASWSMEP